MSENSFFKVGWVKEAHGLKGEVYVKLLSKSPEWLSELSEFCLEKKGSQTLHKVKKWREHKQGLILLIEGVTDRNQSEELRGSDFCIPADLLTSEEGENPYLIEVMGFEVTDQVLGVVGQVVGFVDNGAQDLLEVKSNEGEIHLVPFVDAFVKELDKKDKKIHMELPEGLIE
ncbi:MAG: ribosome maturation factor RimM [Pseudomonadota bacterium]